MKLFEKMDKELEQLLDSVEESDWYLDEFTEKQILERLNEEDSLLDLAAKVKEIETGRDALRQWKSDAEERIRKMDKAAGQLRASITYRLCVIEAAGSKAKVNSPSRGIRLWKVEGRDKVHKQDLSLEKEKHFTGYEESQVEACSIPRSFFKPVTLYKLDTQLVMEYLKAGKKVNGVELVNEPHVVIKTG